jgi:hypothetical protein
MVITSTTAECGASSPSISGVADTQTSVSCGDVQRSDK